MHQTQGYPLTAGDFNTQISAKYVSSGQKTSRETWELIDILHQIASTDTYKIFYSNTKEHSTQQHIVFLI